MISPRIALALALALWPTASALADEFEAIFVLPPAEFRAPLEGGPVGVRVDRELEPSALEPIGDGRYLLVAHDKEAPLRVVNAADAFEVGRLAGAGFPAESPKWEAMARDSEGVFYAVGSHSGKTEGERLGRRSLIRFALLGADGLRPAVDEASFASWKLDEGLARALRRLGLPESDVDRRKIEGLAIREPSTGPRRRELVVGLRTPDDLVRAFAIDLTDAPADGAELSPELLFAFDPGSVDGVRRQLTSLEYVPGWGGFAVVTATEDDRNAFHGNTLWFAPDARIARGPAIEPEKAWDFVPAMKAEGLCLLPGPPGASSFTVRLAITFDNDAHVTGKPGRLAIVDLTRRAGR